MVVTVDENGPAAEKDLRPGDVIAEVDQKAVTSPADVRDRVKSAQENGYRLVTLADQPAGRLPMGRREDRQAVESSEGQPGLTGQPPNCRRDAARG